MPIGSDQQVARKPPIATERGSGCVRVCGERALLLRGSNPGPFIPGPAGTIEAKRVTKTTRPSGRRCSFSAGCRHIPDSKGICRVPGIKTARRRRRKATETSEMMQNVARIWLKFAAQTFRMQFMCRCEYRTRVDISIFQAARKTRSLAPGQAGINWPMGPQSIQCKSGKKRRPCRR